METKGRARAGEKERERERERGRHVPVLRCTESRKDTDEGESLDQRTQKRLSEKGRGWKRRERAQSTGRTRFACLEEAIMGRGAGGKGACLTKTADVHIWSQKTDLFVT